VLIAPTVGTRGITRFQQNCGVLNESNQRNLENFMRLVIMMDLRFYSYIKEESESYRY
jgi:hypothetical protein